MVQTRLELITFLTLNTFWVASSVSVRLCYQIKEHFPPFPHLPNVLARATGTQQHSWLKGDLRNTPRRERQDGKKTDEVGGHCSTGVW